MALIENLKQRSLKDFSLDRLLAHFEVEVEAHVVKKNNRPIYGGKNGVKSFVGKSDRLKKAESNLTRHFRSQANEQQIAQPFDGPLWVIMLFHFKKESYFTKASKFTERSKFVPDLSNLYELPLDCLQAAGVILDDNLVESHDLSRRLVGNETKLEVFVLRY